MNVKPVAIGLSVIGVAAICWWISGHGNESGERNPANERPTSSAATANPAPEYGSESPTLKAAKELVRSGSDVDRKSALESLNAELQKLGLPEQADAIRRLLDAHLDAPTALGFKIAAKGWLDEAPTLRTYLLDRLGAADPLSAAIYGRQILQVSDSPDEWAVALRNIANTDSSAGTRALLTEKTRSLLANTHWQINPSVGYLEAFDTAVYLNDPGFVPLLSDLVSRKDNQAIAHAAFLSLDRLVIQQPVQVLTALEQNPGWMTGREDTRANYFARADVSDPEQKRLVENYLLDPSRTSREIDTFAGIFPNANFMISQNLLSSNRTMDGSSLRARDAASLKTVDSWSTDPRFEKLRGQLSTIRSRLNQFSSDTAK